MANIFAARGHILTATSGRELSDSASYCGPCVYDLDEGSYPEDTMVPFPCSDPIDCHPFLSHVVLSEILN